MSERVEIEQPLGGFSTALRRSDQDPQTTSLAANVRGIDPSTGRLRIAQRSGVVQYGESSLGASKVTALDIVTYDQKQVTYTARLSDALEERWSSTTSGSWPCYRALMDSQGNTIALDGRAGLALFNGTGLRVGQIALPAPEKEQEARALEVGELDAIYVGISAGGTESEGRLWRYIRGEDPVFALEWEETIDGRVTDIRERDGALYVLYQKPSRYRAWLRRYDALGAGAPVQTWTREVPYPANALDVFKDAVYTVHEAFASRGTDPKYPGIGARTVGWTIADLTNAESRRWASLRASEIDPALEYKQEEEITQWFDVSGKSRHLFPNPDLKPPRFTENAVGDWPGVKFDGESAGLISASNASAGVTANSKDDQRTILPGYKNSAFCLFILARLAPRSEAEYSQQLKTGVVLFQANNSSAHNSGTRKTRCIIANRDEGGSAIADNAKDLEGELSIWEYGNTAAGGSDNMPISMNFKSTTFNTVLLTYLCDGGLDDGLADASTATTRSLWRVNGTPLDRWHSVEETTDGGNLSYYATQLGKVFDSGGAGESQTKDIGFLAGSILQIEVLTSQSTTGLETVLSHPLYPDTAWVGNSTTEMEKIEGWIMHEKGLQSLLDNGAYPHPYRANAPVSAKTFYVNKLNSTGTIIAKFNASSGELVWAESGLTGVGYGVAAAEGAVYTFGANGATPSARKIVDKGDIWSVSGGDGAWENTASFNLTTVGYNYLRIGLDTHSNVYLPIPQSQATSGRDSFVLLKSNGTELVDDSFEHNSLPFPAYCVGLPRTEPEYGADLDNSITIKTPRVEFCVLATNEAAAGETPGQGQPTVRSIGLVSAAKNGAAPRATSLIGLCAGDLQQINPAISAVTNGTNVLEASGYVHSFAALQRLYYLDGLRGIVYDPKTNTASVWAATSAGSLDARYRLGVYWNGRVVLARHPDSPHRFAASAVGEPNNWDLEPVPGQIIRGQAFEGTEDAARFSPISSCPDIINALCPASSDVLLFGCDRSIYALSGDPTAGGGFDLVSSDVGMSFGRPWCLDPSGIVYFHSTNGRVYRLDGNTPIPVSDQRVERELMIIDLSAYFVRMIWDQEQRGLRLFVLPYADTTAAVTHWFMDQRSNAWWPDRFAGDLAAYQPTAVAELDGDLPDDRRLLMGTVNGLVGAFERDEPDDFGQAMVPDVLIGPVNPATIGRAVLVSQFACMLDPARGGCLLRVYSADIPLLPDTPAVSAELQPGRNVGVPERVRGNHVWMRLSSGKAGNRWALETLHSCVEDGGVIRP